MKRGGKESNLYVALVTLVSSAGVKYRHGVALVSFFSCDMWVPLWVTGIGSVSCILIRIYFLHTTVVLLTTFNIYNFYTHNGDDIP